MIEIEAVKHSELAFSVIPIAPKEKRLLIQWQIYQKRRARAQNNFSKRLNGAWLIGQGRTYTQGVSL